MIKQNDTYRNWFLESNLVEATLELLEVLHELVVELDVPLYSGHFDGTWVDRVKNLAINGSSCALFELRQFKLYGNENV